MQPRQRYELALVRGGDGGGGDGSFGFSGSNFSFDERSLQPERGLRAREQSARVRHGVHTLVTGQSAADVRRLVRIIIVVTAPVAVAPSAVVHQERFIVIVLLRSVPIAQQHELRSVITGLAYFRYRRSRRVASLQQSNIIYYPCVRITY